MNFSFNFCLLIVFLLLYVINFIILKRNSNLISHRVNNLESSKEVLQELSLDFNHQVLELSYSKKKSNIFLEKYQEDKNWYIKIIVMEINKNDLNGVTNYLSSLDYTYQEVWNLNKIHIINLSDINIIIKILKSLSEIIYKEIDSDFIFTFTKKSVLI